MKKIKILVALLVLSMMSSVSSCGSFAKESEPTGSYANTIWNSTPDEPHNLNIPEWCKLCVDDYYSVPLAYSDVSPNAVTRFNPMLSALGFNTYYVYDDGTNRYALIKYTCFSYLNKFTQLKSVNYTYKNNKNVTTLNLTLEPVVEDSVSGGDGPNMSTFYLVIKLEQKIQQIYVDIDDTCTESDSGRDSELYLDEYSGGITRIGENYGYLGPDMGIVIQPEYKMIRKLRTDSKESYYYAVGSSGTGILDENMKWILKPDLGYDEFFYLDGSFPVACIYGDDENDNSWLYTIDVNGNKTGGKIQGTVKSVRENAAFCNRDHVAVIFQLKDGKIYYGVVNSDLDVIIPPIYSDISQYDDAKWDRESETGYHWVICFACKNEDGKYAIFLPDGTQYTEFIYDSAYDAYQTVDRSMKE